MDELIIEISQMEFAYPRGQVVLEVPRLSAGGSSFLLVIGPNGAGKSTLCKLLAGILLPTKYQLFKVPHPPPVMIWQEQELFPLTVEANLLVVNKDQLLVNKLLQNFELDSKRDSFPWKLSGGDREKLAIARALARAHANEDFDENKVKAIVFDEPTQSIDPSFVPEIAKRILEVHDQGVATLVVTHDSRLVSLLSRVDPSVYAIEPTGRRLGAATKSVLKGPFELENLFKKPPTLFTAEFVGQENIFRIVDDAGPLSPRNLVPFPDEDIGPGLNAVIVPEGAIEISAGGDGDGIEVELVSVEYRNGGQVVVRYRWTPGAGIRPLEFVSRLESQGHKIAYLSIIPEKCLRIQT